MTISSKYPSIKPSLLLDFANTKSIDPRIIFSRASTATYFDNTGLMKTAAANVGRINHDPVTGACKGFLIEEQRTNLLTYSEQFDNAAWTKNSVNVTANAIPAPDGSMTADLLLNNATDVTHYTVQTVTGLVDNTSYTYSVSVKAGTVGFVYLRFRDKSSTFSNFMVNLADGSIVSQTAGLVCGVIPQGDGWYRCYMTRSAGTGANNPTVWLYSSIDGIDAGATEDVGIYAWGAQLEAGAFPTSYIPTTSAQVTRAADSASMTGANFTSWYNPSEGTLFLEADLAVVAGKISHIASLNSETPNNYMSFARISGTSGVGRITASGVTQSDCYLGEFASGIPRKTASAYKENNFAASANGGTAVTDSSGTIPTVSTLTIGGFSNDPTLRMNGHIKRLAYYPKRLSDIELQAITS